MNLFYFTVLCLPVAFEYIYEKSRSDLFRYLGMSICIVGITFRRNVGIDLDTYYSYFSSIRTQDEDSILDFGYYYLNRIFDYFHLPFNLLLFLIALFNVIVLYKFLDYYVERNKYLALIIYYFVFDIFTYSLSAIRQSIAISFLLLVIMSYYRKSTVGVILMAMLGTLFHWSLLPFMLLFAIFAIKKNVKYYSLFIIAILVPIVYSIVIQSSVVVELLSSFNSHLDIYFSVYGNQEGNIIKMILYIILSFAWIIFFCSFRSDEDDTIHYEDIELNSVINVDIAEWLIIAFFISKSCLSIVYNVTIPRIQMYLYFLLPFVFVKKYNKIMKHENDLIPIIIAVILLLDFNKTVTEFYDFYGNAQFGLF